MCCENILSDQKCEVRVLFNKSSAIFSFSDFNLVCRLIDGKYPNYEAVIPNENPNLLEIDRSQLLSSLKRVSILGMVFS